MFTRRGLLKMFGASAVSLLLGGRVFAEETFLFKPSKKSLPIRKKNAFMQGSAALIGVSSGRSPMEMVKEAVGVIGGFERLDLKGKTILVKPNVVSGEKNPATTNPEVIFAVVKLLYEYGAKLVYVGDMSALMTLSTLRNMKKNGIYRSAIDSGAEVIVFEDYDFVDVELNGAEYVRSARVTEWLYNVDVIVNLPVIKTHRSAVYTICLKNFIGCTHLKQRPYLIDSSHWEELVSEFNLAYTPDINIVDGTRSMIEGGPWSGQEADTNLIIASGDRVGADIFGLGVIKSYGKWAPVADMDVWEQRQIKRAVRLGVGNGKEGLKLVIGEKSNALVNKARAFTGL